MGFEKAASSCVGAFSRAFGSYLLDYKIEVDQLTLVTKRNFDKYMRELLRPYVDLFFKENFGIRVKQTYRKNLLVISLREEPDESHT